MKKILIVCCLLIAMCRTEAKTISVVPKPVKMELTAGKGFELTPASEIGVGTKELLRTADLFAAQVKDVTGFAPKSKVGTKKKGGIGIVIDPAIGQEAYRLAVSPERITIQGGSPRGVFYGLQTLRQLILQCYEKGKVTIPALRIEDEPFFAYRGMMLDVCRHFRNTDEVKRYIDLLSMHKLNTFHWHLTEDQGWRISIDKYPELTAVGAERAQTVIGHARTSKEYDGKPYGKGMFYTKEQIKEIVQYAAERHIDVLPEIEMPGHALAALAAYPWLGCTGKDYQVSPTWGVFDDVFCAGKEETFGFFEDVLSEVIDLFPYKYLHIGGDECPKTRWKECPLCQQRIKDNHLADEHELQSYFMKRIETFVKSKGKSIIGWEEILEGGVSPTATVMSWKSPVAGIEAAKRGNKVIMVPSKFSYFDYYQSENKANEPMAIGGFVPVSKVYEYDPYTDLNTEEQKSVLGVQANLWTEYIPQMKGVEYMVLPRMAAMAENGWSYNRKNYDDFLLRMQSFKGLYDLYGFNYAKHIFAAYGSDGSERTSSDASKPLSGSKCIVAGYIPGYKIQDTAPGDLSYLNKPTRVYFFGIYPDASGAWQMPVPVNQKLAVVKSVLLPSQEIFAVAGGGATATPNMHVMGRDAAAREAYATALVNYAHRHNFDGIDVDWETDWSKSPAVPVRKEDFVDLIAKIRAKMNALPATTRVKKISTALGSRAEAVELAYAVKDLVDQVSVMLYDFYGTREEGYPHAPLEMFRERLESFVGRGIPKSKILGGVPFYGGDYSRSPVATREYKGIYNESGNLLTSASNSHGGYAFNGVDLLVAKSRYLVDNAYAGIMIWELSQDLPYAHPLSLMKAIKSVTDK